MRGKQTLMADKRRINDMHIHTASLTRSERLFEVIDRTEGVEHACILSLTRYMPEYVLDNALALMWKRLRPNSVFAFGGVHHPYDAPKSELDFAAEIRLLMRMGFDGYKMYEAKPAVRRAFGEPLNSPFYDPLYRYLNGNRIPVLNHVADPFTFWDPTRAPKLAVDNGWCYFDPSFIRPEVYREEMEDVFTRYPDIPFVLAHFYFMSDARDQAEILLSRHKNVNLDITPGSEMYDGFSKDTKAWRDFFMRHRKRIFFGSDNGFLSESEELVPDIKRFLETDDVFNAWSYTIHGICLPEDVLQDIYFNNFNRLVGTSPKPVDIKLAEKEFEYAGRLIRDRHIDSSYSSDLDDIHGIFVAGIH